MSHIDIDVKNERIVSTGTAKTGLKGDMFADRLMANQQLGKNDSPFNVTFLDDGINNHVPFINGIVKKLLEKAGEDKNFILPSAIEVNCIWVKLPDDNPQAGTDNSHGEVGRLRTMFGAPNPQDMEAEGISEVAKGDILPGSEYEASDFRTAIKELEQQITQAPEAGLESSARLGL